MQPDEIALGISHALNENDLWEPESSTKPLYVGTHPAAASQLCGRLAPLVGVIGSNRPSSALDGFGGSHARVSGDHRCVSELTTVGVGAQRGSRSVGCSHTQSVGSC
jgi:hypothetical protein